MRMLQNGMSNNSGGMGISGYSNDPAGEITNQLQVGQPLNMQSDMGQSGQQPNMNMGGNPGQQPQFMNLSNLFGHRNNMAQNSRSNMNANRSNQGWGSFMGNDPSSIMNNLMQG